MSYQHINTKDSKNEYDDLLKQCLQIREALKFNTEITELEAFVSFAFVFKNSPILLIDTYNTIESGVKNVIILAIALDKINCKIGGIRLDSGDLAELSK